MKTLYIDVNDPRNEFIIKLLRETRNEFLVRLLSEDSKNMLSSTQPFRIKLLQARHKDPNFGKMFIPMLENEITDSNRSSFFLEQLEHLFRNEAYLLHLDKRVQHQQVQREQGVEQLMENRMDLDSLRRR